jgi:hypothetical protein
MKTIDQKVAAMCRRRRSLEKQIRAGKKIRYTSDEESTIADIRAKISAEESEKPTN